MKSIIRKSHSKKLRRLLLGSTVLTTASLFTSGTVLANVNNEKAPKPSEAQKKYRSSINLPVNYNMMKGGLMAKTTASSAFKVNTPNNTKSVILYPKSTYIYIDNKSGSSDIALFADHGLNAMVNNKNFGNTINTNDINPLTKSVNNVSANYNDMIVSEKEKREFLDNGTLRITVKAQGVFSDVFAITSYPIVIEKSSEIVGTTILGYTKHASYMKNPLINNVIIGSNYRIINSIPEEKISGNTYIGADFSAHYLGACSDYENVSIGYGNKLNQCKQFKDTQPPDQSSNSRGSVYLGSHIDIKNSDLSQSVIIGSGVNLDSVDLSNTIFFSSKNNKLIRLTNVDTGKTDTDVITYGQLRLKKDDLNKNALHVQKGLYFDPGGYKITNIADGKEKADAISVGQIKRFVEFGASNKLNAGNFIIGMTSGITGTAHTFIGKLSLGYNGNNTQMVTVGSTIYAFNNSDSVIIGSRTTTNGYSHAPTSRQTIIGYKNDHKYGKASRTISPASFTTLGANIVFDIRSTENSVVLGAGSTIETGQSDVVSFGKKGSERILTNIAAGAHDNDVVTYGQLKNDNNIFDGMRLNYTGNFSALGKKILNVADGKQNTDAINVKQMKDFFSNEIVTSYHGPEQDGWSHRNVFINSSHKNRNSFFGDNVNIGYNIIAKNSAKDVNLGTKIHYGDKLSQNVNIGFSIAPRNTSSDKVDSTKLSNINLGANTNSSADSTKNSVVIGQGSTIDTDQSGVVSFGKKGSERRLTNIAAGADDNDVVNISQLKKYTFYYNGKNYNAESKKISNVLAGTASSDAINFKQVKQFVNYGQFSSNDASPNNNIFAIGSKNSHEDNNQNTTIIGTNQSAEQGYLSGNHVSIGSNITARYVSLGAFIGSNNTFFYDEANLGVKGAATSYQVVIGSFNDPTYTYTGKDIVHKQNSVILGNNISFAAKADSTKNNVIIGHYSTIDTDQSGVVSFGKKGSERRLTNIAAGADDNDVVNISQLKKYTFYYNGKNYNAESKKISNVLAGTASSDAINFKQVKQFVNYGQFSSNDASPNNNIFAIGSKNSHEDNNQNTTIIGTNQSAEQGYLSGNHVSIGSNITARYVSLGAFIGSNNTFFYDEANLGVEGAATSYQVVIGSFNDPTYTYTGKDIVHKQNSVILGNNISFAAKADSTKNNVIIGHYSTIDTDQSGVVSFGKKGSERRLTNIAAGADDNDVVIYKQLIDRFTAVKPMVLNAKGCFDANSKAIYNLGDAKADNDAINVKQLKSTVTQMARKKNSTQIKMQNIRLIS
ncbi:hypothetical protein [Bartonella sp. DGB1]|uniref:hypothetical protein n=1 Tax=Bartonella sp. DGB1 TaxID=3239807 RepID=UPI0035246C9D